jgi:nucleoside-diphosphate-sugar epimerase
VYLIHRFRPVVSVCRAFIDSTPQGDNPLQRPFVYISAEDIFRPFIPARYIESKYEAEAAIEQLVSIRPDEFRGVFIRPSLVYHAHLRPLTTPPAALLDLSAALHSKVPEWAPTPSKVLRHLGTSLAGRGDAGLGSSLESIASALVTRPMHVDQVAGAVCATLESAEIKGVVDVDKMRSLLHLDS